MIMICLVLRDEIDLHLLLKHYNALLGMDFDLCTYRRDVHQSKTALQPVKDEVDKQYRMVRDMSYSNGFCLLEACFVLS